jgi:hypothetical protein
MIDHVWRKLTDSQVSKHNNDVDKSGERSFSRYAASSSFICDNCGYVLSARYILPKTTIDSLVPSCQDRVLSIVMNS